MNDGLYRMDSDKDPFTGEITFFGGLWDIWDSVGSKDALIVDRKRLIADWYRNIHEGRCLFFQENSLTGYGRRKSKNISISEKVKRFDRYIV